METYMTNYIELAQKITEQLKKETEILGVISENPLSEFDHSHPYMSVNLDLYYDENGPPSAVIRHQIFEQFGIEVSNETRSRTYGYHSEIPIELRCIDKRILDYLVHHLDTTTSWTSYERNTEVFYNITHGNILFQQGSWLDEFRKFLQSAPELMWINLKSHAVSHMTLDLALFEDALAHHDRALTIQAQGRFLEGLLQVLFFSNRSFPPPLRLQQLELEKLEILPFNFAQHFDELLDFHSNTTKRLESALQLATEATLL